MQELKKWYRFGVSKEEFYKNYCVFCKELTKKEKCKGHYFVTPTTNRFMEHNQFVSETLFNHEKSN